MNCLSKCTCTQHHQRAESDIKGLGRHSSGDRQGHRGHPRPPHSQLSRTGKLSSSMTRWKINEAAREVLEDQYMRKRFPSPLSKKRLAEQLDVAPRRIQVWFQNRRQREKAGTEESEETPRQSPSFEDELDGVGDDGVGDDLWSESTEPTVRADWQQRDPWGSETSEPPMRSDWQQDSKGPQEWQQDAKGPQDWQQGAKGPQEWQQQQQDSEAQQDALMMQGINNLVQGLPEDASDGFPAGEGAPILSSSDDIFQARTGPAPWALTLALTLITPLPTGPAPSSHPVYVPGPDSVSVSRPRPSPLPRPLPRPRRSWALRTRTKS